MNWGQAILLTALGLYVGGIWVIGLMLSATRLDPMEWREIILLPITWWFR